jgi:N-acetylglucosaminyldiphosphoundecaprenol N-acetyl-beta-D-mannosaminyltransferase
MESIQLLTIKINLGTYSRFVDELIAKAQVKQSYYTCVANVHMVVEAHKSQSYAEIINNADLVTPDGEPLTWALRFLFGIKQPRVAGMDLLPDLLAAAEQKKIPVAFYGGTQNMLDKTREHLAKKYPEIIIAKTISPPFRLPTPDEERETISMLNESGAGLVFIVLGCPKQEKWMSGMKNKINAVMVGIGGALPVLVGMQKRAPSWMQHGGLEWLFRLGQEPRRLFKRYANTNSVFIYLLFKRKIFSKK